jgi:hypothetical protein
MGFSGGGTNILKPHQHDGTVVQDGGPLNMDNVTQAQLNQGDIVFSDGVHLQRLAYPGVPAGESLTAAAASTAPAWIAAGGSGVTVLDSGQGVNSFDVGGSADPTFDSYRFIQIFVSWESSATGSVSLQFYDTAGTINGGTDYQRFAAVANQYVGSVYKETDIGNDLILTSNEINTGHYEIITFPVYPTFGTSINLTWQTSSMPNGTLEMRTTSALVNSVSTNIRGITNNGTGIVAGTCNYTVLGIP